MADDITTVLRFVGDAGNAESAINSLIASLQRAAAQTAAFFTQSVNGGNQSAAALGQTSAAAEQAAKTTRRAVDGSLALAQAQARLQATQGSLAAAQQTLRSALEGVSGESRAAIRAQTQLAQVQNQIVAAAQKAAIAQEKAGQSADRRAQADQRAVNAALAFAQATARQQVAEGNLAGARQTLVSALNQVTVQTTTAIRAQTQLTAIESQLATAASKAETAMLREAQAIARLQQISGNTPAAIKTLSDALDKAGNKSSLPALRAELQKTYLDTNYANSPLIGAIRESSDLLSRFLPLLGPVGNGIQRVIGFASAVGAAFNDGGKKSTEAVQGIAQAVSGLTQTSTTVAQVAQTAVNTVAGGLSAANQTAQAVQSVSAQASNAVKALAADDVAATQARLKKAFEVNAAIVANSKAEQAAATAARQLGQAEVARQSAIRDAILANQRVREKAVGEIAREEKQIRSLISAERERVAQAGKTETALQRQAAEAGKAAGAFGLFARAKEAASSFFRDQGGSATLDLGLGNLVKLAATAGERLKASIGGAVESVRARINSLGSLRSPFTTIFSGGEQAKAQVDAVSKTLPSLASSAGQATEALGGLSSAGGGTSLAMGAVGVAVLGAVAAIAAIVTVTAAAASGLRSIGEAGIQTNAQLETLKVGLTTVIASVAEIRNSDGVQLRGVDAINAALPVAADQLRKLRIDALETSATIADIAPAFQAAIGPGLAAGLTIDQIRENTIRLTQAVTALGLPMDQIKQETRAILSGEINRTTQAATALGITRQEVLEAQKAGKFAEFLDQKLAAAAAAGKLVATTFAAASSNLQEAGDTFQAVVTEGLFNQVRDKLNEVLKGVFDKGQANLISKNFEGISETLTRIFDTAGQTIGRVIDFVFNGLKQISAFLDQNQETVGVIIESVNQIVVILAQMTAAVFEIITGATGQQKAFEGVAQALTFIVKTIGYISDLVKIQISLFFTVGNTIRVAVIAPLELAVTILAKLLDFIPGVGGALDGFARSLTTARQAATAGVTDSAKQFASAVSNVGKSSAEAAKRIEESRKRAAAGQRAVDGVETKTPKTTGATFKPPKRPQDDENKGAAGKARQEAAAQVKLLQNLEKQAELANKRVAEGLKASLTDRLVSLETYTELAIENDRELLQKRLASLDAEEKAAVRTAKNATEAEAKRQEFALKRATLQQDADLKAEELRDSLRRTQEKAEEDHQKRLLDIQEIGRKALESSIRDAVRRGAIGQVEGERQAIDLERTRLAEREGILNADLEAARENLQERQKIADELSRLAAERAAFEEDASRRIRDAQAKEAADFTALVRARVAAVAQLRRAELEAQTAQAALAVQQGRLGNRDAQLQELARRREAIRLETIERQAAIEKEGQDLARQAQLAGANATALIEIERNKNAQLTAERQRASAEIQIIQNQTAALEAIFGGGFAGLFNQRVNELSANLGLFKAVLTDFKESVETTITPLNDILLGAFNGVAEGIGSIVQNYVTLGKTGPAAIRKLLAAQLAAIAQEAAVNSIKQLALGFATLFTNPAESAGHFTSAAIWAGIAGGAAIAGRAVAPKEGGGGGNFVGSETGGDRGTQIVEQGGRLPAAQPIQITIRARTEPGTIVDIVDADYRNNGRLRDTIRRDTIRE